MSFSVIGFQQENLLKTPIGIPVGSNWNSGQFPTEIPIGIPISWAIIVCGHYSVIWKWPIQMIKINLCNQKFKLYTGLGPVVRKLISLTQG